MAITCLCGCGVVVRRRYVRGHNARTEDNALRDLDVIARSVAHRSGDLNYARKRPEAKNWMRGEGNPLRRSEVAARVSAKLRGCLNPMWKDITAREAAGLTQAEYLKIHKWVREQRPYTGVCQRCERTNCRTENANISGRYQLDLNDWIELCVSCHKRQEPSWRS